MKKPIFTKNRLFHIYNRGVDGRTVFTNAADYFRAIHDLWEFNDTNPALHLALRRPNSEVQLPNLELPNLERFKAITRERKARDPLVRIHAYVLMKNYYHLLVEQVADSGISEFMRKFGTGYTNYFNIKHQRSGALFQGRFKAIEVVNDSYFIHIPYYIHSNPLDYKFPSWRKREVLDASAAIKYLMEYRWSSFPDYAGKRNFPSVIYKKLLDGFYNKPQWLKQMYSWLDSFEYDKNIYGFD